MPRSPRSAARAKPVRDGQSKAGPAAGNTGKSRRPAGKKGGPARKARPAKSSARREAGTRSRAAGRAARARRRTAVRVLGVGLALIALAGFIYVAARLTFTPVDDGGQAVGNTDVGRSLRFYLDRPSVKEAALQVGGNLVLLAPLGVLLPVAFARLRRVLRMLVVAGLVSLAVETIQGTLIHGRAFDIDDVILNTAGVVLAYLLAGRKIAELVRGPA